MLSLTFVPKEISLSHLKSEIGNLHDGRRLGKFARYVHDVVRLYQELVAAENGGAHTSNRASCEEQQLH